jgi:hypothetical protein
MTRRDRILEYGLVAIVAVLIWLYAEGAIVQEYPKDGTRAVQIRVEVTGDDLVILEQPVTEVQLQFRGSAAEISELEGILAGTLTLRPDITAVGEQRPVLRDLVMLSPELAKLHVNLLTNHKPKTLQFTIDRLVTRKVNLVFVPSIDLEPDTLKISPQQIDVRLPQMLAETLGPNTSFEVEPVEDLQTLARGVPLAGQVARLKLPAVLAQNPYASYISISPSQVELAFTIKSDEIEGVVKVVDVQLLVPETTQDKFRVVLHDESKVFHNVKVSGPAALVTEVVNSKKPMVSAFIKLGADLLGREAGGKDYITANVQFDKPEGLKVLPAKTTVRFKVERIE